MLEGKKWPDVTRCASAIHPRILIFDVPEVLLTYVIGLLQKLKDQGRDCLPIQGAGDRLAGHQLLCPEKRPAERLKGTMRQLERFVYAVPTRIPAGRIAPTRQKVSNHGCDGQSILAAGDPLPVHQLMRPEIRTPVWRKGPYIWLRSLGDTRGICKALGMTCLRAGPFS
jgi:hypothetical protein